VAVNLGRWRPRVRKLRGQKSWVQIPPAPPNQIGSALVFLLKVKLGWLTPFYRWLPARGSNASVFVVTVRGTSFCGSKHHRGRCVFLSGKRIGKKGSKWGDWKVAPPSFPSRGGQVHAAWPVLRIGWRGLAEQTRRRSSESLGGLCIMLENHEKMFKERLSFLSRLGHSGRAGN